jgi:hypothetical protein
VPENANGSPQTKQNLYPMKNLLTTAALLVFCTVAIADVKPLPRAQWPGNLAEAVPLIIATLNPTQRSIIGGTSKDSLRLHLGEWGEDIEKLLGLDNGNTVLVAAVCGRPCRADEATLALMEATWEALQK